MGAVSMLARTFGVILLYCSVLVVQDNCTAAGNIYLPANSTYIWSYLTSTRLVNAYQYHPRGILASMAWHQTPPPTINTVHSVMYARSRYTIFNYQHIQRSDLLVYTIVLRVTMERTLLHTCNNHMPVQSTPT